jgi:hypothetical protein
MIAHVGPCRDLLAEGGIRAFKAEGHHGLARAPSIAAASPPTAAFCVSHRIGNPFIRRRSDRLFGSLLSTTISTMSGAIWTVRRVFYG